MKKRFRRVLLVASLMVAALASGVFAACSYGVNQEENKKKEGYSCCVTYDANGGTFGSDSTRTYALVKENSLTPAPGYVDAKTQASVKVPTRMDYQLVGEAADDGDDETNDEAILTQSWFLAETDEDGNVLSVSTTPWDFTKNKVTQDITLVAQWKEVFRYQIYLVDKNADGQKVQKEIRTYPVEPGDTIIDKLYNKDKTTKDYVIRADYIKITASNYTLLEFYLDEALTQPLTKDTVHPGRHEVEVTEINPETKQEETKTIMTNTVSIYVKYLSGKYEKISNNNLKPLTESSKWYLLEDVDYSTVEQTALPRFNGEIYGNGYTIKNLTVSSLAVKPTSGYVSHSIFGAFNGVLDNVKLENVTLNVKTQYNTNVPGEQRASFFADSFTANGLMKNVTLSGCRILFTNAGRYEHVVTENSLWATAPAASAVQNVTGSVQVEEA